MATNFNKFNPANVLNEAGKSVTSQQSQVQGDLQDFILDDSWAKQAFLISDKDLALGSNNSQDAVNRYWSSASRKFTDTSFGGNIGVNARPQFCRYSDIRTKGLRPDRVDCSTSYMGGNLGMGRYYSEAIDDNAQRIFMRFGVPQFNSMLNFIKNAFDPTWVSMVRTGRADFKVLRELGELAGNIAAFVAFPVMSSAIIFAKSINFVFGIGSTSKFYTLKPTMFMYWSTVNTLVNTYAINKGILPFFNDNATQTQGTEYKFDNDMVKTLHTLLPDIISESGYIDVMAFALRAQVLANEQFIKQYDEINVGSNSKYIGYVKKYDRTMGNKIFTDTNKPTFLAYLNRLLDFGSSYYEQKDNKVNTETFPGVNSKTGTIDPANGAKHSFGQYFSAEARDGASFASFIVDFTGSVSEGFSNSAVESSLSSKLNNQAAATRETLFSLEGGNILGDTVSSVVAGATDVVSGALSGVTFGFSDSVLSYLSGAGYVDIPKHWQSSSASLPRSNYTMQLISPYNNVFSQLQNIFIPLFMIMAGSLPLSTGKQSYGSPFLVQLFDRGRNQIQLGMIESLSITRGTANLPFTNQGSPLAIDVSFTVMDLSSLMHMPVSTGGLFTTISNAAKGAINPMGNGNGVTDRDNILYDYLAVLAGQDIYSQIYALPRAKLNMAKSLIGIKQLSSPAWWAMFGHNEVTSGVLKYTPLNWVSNVYEAAVAGSNTVTNSNNQSPTG